MRRDPLAPYLSAGATLLASGALVPVVTAHSWPWYALLMVTVVTVTGIGLRTVTRSPGSPGGWVQLSVVERSTGRLVGDVGMSPADAEPGV